MNTTDSTIPQLSHSAIKRAARLANQGKRNFGGKLTDFTDNRERHFYQRMLKAYIRGNDKFAFGFTTVKDEYGITRRVNQYYPVEFTDLTRDANQVDALLANGFHDPGKVFGGVKPSKRQLKDTIQKRLELERALKKAEGSLDKTGDAISDAGKAGSKAGKAIRKFASHFLGK